MIATLSPAATAALIGAAVGWLLGFLSDFAREELRARRARRVAALLIYGELTSNVAAVSALRKHGVWSTERIHRTAWEGQGAALLYRADIDRVGHLSQAYSSLEDVAFLVAEGKARNFTRGEDAEFLDDTLMPFIYAGMREVGPLAGINEEEVERRIQASVRATQGPSQQPSG